MCTLTATLFLAVAARTVYAEEPLVLVQTIQLKGVEGKLDHLAVDSKGQRLFVANKINNTLDVVDLKTGKLVTQIPDQGKVSGVAFAGDLDMVYVGNGSGVCNGFDCKTFKEVFSTKAPGADNVHYHSGNHMVYVAQDEAISVLDAKTGEVKAAIKMPGSTHGFKIDKKAAKLFVVLAKPNQIGVIDLNKNELLEKFPLSDAGSPIAYDAKNGLLFVGYSKGAKVVALDAKTGKELAAIAIPAGIDDLHFDSKRNRLYASCSDSALIVIEKKGENYEVIAKIETPKLSKTSAWSSNKLFLGVPKQGGKEGPEVRVFEARPVIEAKSSGEEKK
jgi:DNA-binding beta-propeller fold protein YncE